MQSEDDDLEGVAFCGIYCDGCFLHAGKIADLARGLRRELRAARFDRAAEALSEVPFLKAFKGYPACDEVLGALVKVRCKRTCREGGGPQHCDIRICCRNKGIDGFAGNARISGNARSWKFSAKGMEMLISGI